MKTNWPHEIVLGVKCFSCGEVPRRPVVVEQGKRDVGVCEACALEAYWAWKSEPRDLPPEQTEQLDGAPRPATLKVLLLKLSDPRPGEDPPSPLVPYSYVLAVGVSGEVAELPSVKLEVKEADHAAAARALLPLGLWTWEPFVELLYDAYSARGELTRLVLCTVWAKNPDDRRIDAARGLDWRGWPPWLAAPASAGLYATLRTVIALRLAKYEAQDPRPPALSASLREVAVRYILTQQAVRRGDKCVDTSMLEYSRSTMTDHERWVAARVKESEELGTQASRDLAEVAAETEEAARQDDSGSATPGSVTPGSEVAPAPAVAPPSGRGSGPATLDEAFNEDNS